MTFVEYAEAKAYADELHGQGYTVDIRQKWVKSPELASTYRGLYPARVKGNKVKIYEVVVAKGVEPGKEPSRAKPVRAPSVRVPRVRPVGGGLIRGTGRGIARHYLRKPSEFDIVRGEHPRIGATPLARSIAQEPRLVEPE